MDIKTKEVKTSVGIWVIKKPKAGVRNKALKAAETNTGIFKRTILMEELLPQCIQQRPDGIDKDVPIDQILNDLEIEDYDILFTELSLLLASEEDRKVTEEEEKKKTSMTSSITINSPNLSNIEQL